MNVFNEEPIQKFTPKTKDSWPIKLAMKYGVKSRERANVVVIVISVILLVITFYIYKQVIFSDTRTDPDDIDSRSFSPAMKAGSERRI